MGQFKDRLIDIYDDQIAEIIREARDEALAEAKGIIKGVMIQAILERALGRLEGTKDGMVKDAPLNEWPLPTAQAGRSTDESEEQIWQEIEVIRRKIAGNERLLGQLEASPIEAKGLRELPVKDEVGAPTKECEEAYGYYVYGIVGGDGGQGIEGLPEEGVDPAHPAYALPYQDIQAIMSKVSLSEFGQERLEANLNDIRWLEAKVYAHQSVLERILARCTPVPMRFCTIYRSERRIQDMLAQRYDAFAEALIRLEGKKEWGGKLYCDGETLAQRVGEVSDGVKELKMEISQKSSGMAYFLRKRLEEVTREEAERLKDDCAQRSHDRLSGYAEEAVINPLRSREVTGREDDMVLNGAYLVAEEQLAGFRAELESLEKEYGGLGFSYEMTGPWPPYNFVTIDFGEGVAGG